MQEKDLNQIDKWLLFKATTNSSDETDEREVENLFIKYSKEIGSRKLFRRAIRANASNK